MANAGDGTLTRIDERTGRPTAHVTVGGSPQALVVAEGKVWVSVQPSPAAEPSGGTLVVSVPTDSHAVRPRRRERDRRTGRSCPRSARRCSPIRTRPGLAGQRLVPEAARAAPTVSDGGRAYTFVIRPGLRFSPPSNEPVTAETFKRTIERSLSPRKSMGLGGSGPGQQELRDAWSAPRPTWPAGAAHRRESAARGDRLTIRVTHPAPDLPERLADFTVLRGAERHAAQAGRAARFPSAGALLHRGPRPRAAASSCSATRTTTATDRGGRDASRSSVGPQHPVAKVEASTSRLRDRRRSPPTRAPGLERRYGAGSPAARGGEQQYFVVPESSRSTMISLNTSRPLFANARMRRAANYAVDRRALAANGGTFHAHATVAQMYLPPGEPGYPRRAHLPAHTRSSPRPTSRRPRPSHSGALLLSGTAAAREQPRSSPRTSPRSASTSRSQYFPGDAVLRPHADARRDPGIWPSTGGEAIRRRSRQLTSTGTRARSDQRRAPPRSPRRLAARVGRPQVRPRARRSRTPVSTTRSYAMPHRRSPLPTRAKTYMFLNRANPHG